VPAQEQPLVATVTSISGLSSSLSAPALKPEAEQPALHAIREFAALPNPASAPQGWALPQQAHSDWGQIASPVAAWQVQEQSQRAL
jgi:hypothetical protein